MNRLQELGAAARQCSNEAYRNVLKTTLDWLDTCLERVHKDPTTSNMVSLNGAWVRAERVLANVPPEAEPTPPQTVAQEMRMAA